MSQDLNRKLNQDTQEMLDENGTLLVKLEDLNYVLEALESKLSIVEKKAASALARAQEDAAGNGEQFMEIYGGHAETIRSLTEILAEGKEQQIAFRTDRQKFADTIDSLIERATKLDEQLQIVEFQQLASDIALTGLLAGLWADSTLHDRP